MQGTRRTTHVLRAALALTLLFLSSCILFYRHGVYDILERHRFDVAELLPRLQDSRLVFVGEQHDNPLHHQAQLEVISQFHEQDLPVAVGLEMFESRDQDVLDRWVAGELDLHEFVDAYYRNWDMPWNLYGDIFVYAREHGIPLIGLNVPREVVNQVARKGFSSLSLEQLESLPGVSCNVDEAYRAFIQRTHEFHAGGDESFERFCEAQMVWDTTMAHRLVEYVEENPGTQVVVVAGSGHAWKPGIPRQVSLRDDHITQRVILPEERGLVNRLNVGVDDCDYLWLGLY